MCLPDLKENFVGNKAVVIGWGRTAHGAISTPSKLQEVEVEVITSEMCQDWFKSNNRRETIFKNEFLCAGYEMGVIRAKVTPVGLLSPQRSVMIKMNTGCAITKCI